MKQPTRNHVEVRSWPNNGEISACEVFADAERMRRRESKLRALLPVDFAGVEVAGLDESCSSFGGVLSASFVFDIFERI